MGNLHGRRNADEEVIEGGEFGGRERAGSLTESLFPMRAIWEKKYSGKGERYTARSLDMMQNNKYYQQKSPPDAVRIVIISDTHSRHRQMARAVPDGDILIHAGDFTNCGRVSEVQEFNDWFTSLPHPHKIVIAGNHEVPFDPKVRGRGRFQKATAHPELHKIKTFLDESKCVYLEDSAVEVAGIKFYGSPHQPAYGQGWAFNMERNSEEIRAKWAAIPDGTDILVTHGPPLGFLDQCSNGDRAGCEDLLREVIGRIKPKYHVFGHVHEAYGMATNGETVFINASTCTLEGYEPTNFPIVIDYSRTTTNNN